MRKAETAALVLTLLVSGAPAARADGGADWARDTRASLGLSGNPLGLQTHVERVHRRQLSESTHALLADAHLSFGISNRLAPAYDRLGVFVELAPVSPLELRIGVEPAVYFGTFRSLMSFDSYDAPFDDDSRQARAEEAAAAIAGRVYVAPTLKLKAGRLLFRARGELERWRAWTDGPYFYEPSRDTLLRAAGDSLLATESVVLIEARSEKSRELRAGFVHALTQVFDAPQNRRQDLGVVGSLGLGRRCLGLRDARVTAKLGRYLEDPNRSGQVNGQLAIAFGLGRSN